MIVSSCNWIDLSPGWFGDDGVDNFPDAECICASRRSIGTLRVWAAARAPDDNVDAFDWTYYGKLEETEWILLIQIVFALYLIESASTLICVRYFISMHCKT